MTGIRFLLLNIGITIAVSAIVLVAGLWWFQMAYVPQFENQQAAAVSSNIDRLTAPAAPENDIPSVVAEALPAVASIVITAEVPLYERYLEQVSPFGSFWGAFNVPRQRQVGTEEREIGGGTGFFVSESGHLITNRHVVDQTGVEYTVVTNDGTTYPVEVIARDPVLDIAVLQVTAPATTFTHLAFARKEPVLGEPVIAIGNALGEFPNSVSVGVVSGLARNITAQAGLRFETLDGLIQTDAAINQGNSGGPLLNSSGEVVGVNVAVAGNSENIGFALPGQVVAEVLDSVLATGAIARPYLGVRYVPITDAIVERNNLPIDYGVLVVRGERMTDLAVIPGSPAAQAGLRENDIITAIDDEALRDGRQLATVMRAYRPGDTTSLTVWRNGESLVIPVTLTTMPE